MEETIKSDKTAFIFAYYLLCDRTSAVFVSCSMRMIIMCRLVCLILLRERHFRNKVWAMPRNNERFKIVCELKSNCFQDFFYFFCWDESSNNSRRDIYHTDFGLGFLHFLIGHAKLHLLWKITPKRPGWRPIIGPQNCRICNPTIFSLFSTNE